MNAMCICGLTFLFCVLNLVFAASADAFQDKRKSNNTFTNAADAGPDFQLQGEYSSEKLASSGSRQWQV